MGNNIEKEHFSMKRLVAHYHGPLLRFFSKHSRNTWDAEELAQEVFCKILKRKDFSADHYPESHLYTIAWSVLRDRARRDKVRRVDKHVSYDETLANEANVPLEDTIAGEERYRRFLNGLERLPPKTRGVFLLSRYEGMTYTQIADHYGIGVSAVEKHMMKAIAQLKKSLEVW